MAESMPNPTKAMELAARPAVTAMTPSMTSHTTISQASANPRAGQVWCCRQSPRPAGPLTVWRSARRLASTKTDAPRVMNTSAPLKVGNQPVCR